MKIDKYKGLKDYLDSSNDVPDYIFEDIEELLKDYENIRSERDFYKEMCFKELE